MIYNLGYIYSIRRTRVAGRANKYVDSSGGLCHVGAGCSWDGGIAVVTSETSSRPLDSRVAFQCRGVKWITHWAAILVLQLLTAWLRKRAFPESVRPPLGASCAGRPPFICRGTP